MIKTPREARQILDELLEKYAEHGAAQFVLPDALTVPPVSEDGQVGDIIKVFGGVDELRIAVTKLQRCSTQLRSGLASGH